MCIVRERRPAGFLVMKCRTAELVLSFLKQYIQESDDNRECLLLRSGSNLISRHLLPPSEEQFVQGGRHERLGMRLSKTHNPYSVLHNVVHVFITHLSLVSSQNCGNLCCTCLVKYSCQEIYSS